MKTEIHIWVGLPPAVYKRFNIIPAMRPAFKFAPDFKSANDEKQEPGSPDGSLPTGTLKSTKTKLTVIVDFPSK
jgi:hypothetical protein